MPSVLLMAAAEVTNAATAPAARSIESMGGYGIVFWLLLALLAAVLIVVLERTLHYRREQIDLAQFLAGVRTVIKRDNLLEALSICDATPGPAARLMKAALQARDAGRDRVREVIAETEQAEVPRLHERLGFLSVNAQVAPLIGVLGTLLGFAGVFRELRRADPAGGGAYGYAAPGEMFDGVLQALYAAALGTLVAVVCHAAHYYLSGRAEALERDLGRAGVEAWKLATGEPAAGGAPGEAVAAPGGKA
jgi:biopolymer transport protein ExbB